MRVHQLIRKGRRAQRGAAAVFAAVAVLAMLTATMLAIEIGRIYATKADLQKQANLAALDAARLVGGCSVESIDGRPTQSDVQAFVQQTLQQNGVALEELSLTQVELGRTIVTEPDAEDPGGRRTLENTLDENAEAVRVTLRRAFPQPFLPLLPSQDGKVMTASATAEQAAVGSFYVGSGLLSLNGGMLNTLLSGLLDGNVALAVGQYSGLAGARVSLLQFADVLGLELQDLSDPLALDSQTPLLGDVLRGLSGQVSGAAGGTLAQLADAAEAGANPPVPVGDLVGTVGDTGADVPSINVLDLVIALAAAGRADDSGAVAPIALPVSLGIPGVATLYAFLQVLEPPQFSGMGRAGEAEAHTAQVRIMVRLRVDALSSISSALTLVLGGGLLGSVTAQPLNLGIDLEVAKASAWLDRIQCPRSADPNVVAELSARPVLAELKLGTFAGAADAAPEIIDGTSQLLGVTINLVGGLLASINVNLFLDDAVQTTVGSAAKAPLPSPVTDFDWIDDDGDTPYWLADGMPPQPAVPGENPQTVGTSGLLGSALSSLSSSLAISASDPAHPDASSSICLLRVLGVCTLQVPVASILNAVLDPVLTVLGTILSPTGALVDSLLDPLLQSLGVQLGTATVTMNTVAIDSVRIVSMDIPPVP